MDRVIEHASFLERTRVTPLVVQLGIKHGRAADLVRSSGNELTIGRGYSNDLVLTDEYVAANQVRLFASAQDQGWYLEVLDDSNGILLNRQSVTRADGPRLVCSGDNLTLGRTRLRVFAEDHPIDAPRKLTSRGWHQGSVGVLLPLLALLASIGLDRILEQWFKVPMSDLLQAGSEVLALLVSVFVWVGIWALIGKMFRNQGNFFPQLLALSVISIVATPLPLLLEWMEFTTNRQQLGNALQYGSALLVGIVILRYHLLLSTNILRTWVVAGVVGCVALGAVLFVGWSEQQGFVSGPVYSRELAPDSVYLGSLDTLDQYMTRLGQDIDTVKATPSD